MLKKALAVVLAGILTLSGAFTVLASAEGAEAEKVSENEELTPEQENAITDFLKALGEEGITDGKNLDGLGSVIGGLIGAFAGEEGSKDAASLDGLLGLLSSLGGEEGSSEDGMEVLGGLLGLLSAFGGEEGSLDEESLTETIVYMATGFLATLEEEGGKIAEIIAQVKNEDGTYDLEKLIDLLENATESEDGSSITIGGVEIGAEEFQAVIEKAAESISAEGEAQDAA